MNINQHFINLATRAAENGANASQIISQRDRLFKDKVVPELVKRNANDAAIAQARTKWNKQTDQVMQSAGLLPKNGQSSTSFAKDKRAEAAIKESARTGSNMPIIKETAKTTADTIGNLFVQGVGGMIEGAAGFVRDIGENEKDSIAAKVAKYGKDLKKGYQDSASTYQKELQAGKHGKTSQLAAGAVQSIPAMAMPFGVAKGAVSAATKVPMLASKAPYIGLVAGNVAEHTQNYGEVRSNATANLQRDFPTWEKLQGNPLFEQRFQQLVNSGVNINAARKQAHADTLDQLSEQAADKYGTAMTAIGFIAPSGAVLGSGILKNAPTSKIGKALVGGGVSSALVRREIAQSPRVGMAKLIPDVSVVANKEAAKMVGKQAAEEGLQGGIGEYGAQAASANIGGQAVDWGKIGQTVLEEGAIGGIMGGGMQSATGGSATSQAKEVAKQLRNQTNQLRQEEAAARSELAQATQFNNPEQIQSAHENLNNIGIAANKVKAAYDQYGIDTPYFVQRFAAQYQPVQQDEQQGVDQQETPQATPKAVPVDPAAAAQPQAAPAQPASKQPAKVNQGMANTTNLVMDSVTKGLITPEEANAIQTDPLRGQVFSLAQSGDDAAAHNVVMNAVSLGNLHPDQAQILITAIPRYKNLSVPIKPSLSGIVDNHVKSQVNSQDGGLFSNAVELNPETLEPIDQNQPSPFQEDFNEPKQFINQTRAKDYIRVNGLTDSHEINVREDGVLEVVKKQGIIPDDPNLNDFSYKPKQIISPFPKEDPNLTDFSDGAASVNYLMDGGIPEILPVNDDKQQPIKLIDPVQPIAVNQSKHDKPKNFTNYVRARHYLNENDLKDTHEIIKQNDGSATIQLKVQPRKSEDEKPQNNNELAVLHEDKKPEPEKKEEPAPEDNLSFADKIHDAHLNNPNAKPKLINDEVAKGRTRPEVLKEVGEIVKSIGKAPEPVQPIAPTELKALDQKKGGMTIEPVRTYLTKSGKVGAEIKKLTHSDGRISYSYSGEWGAGSVDAKAMQDEESGWKAKKHGYTVQEHEAPVSSQQEQKTDENGIQENDMPDGMKAGDIGRGSDGKPYLSKNAALRGLKLNNVKDTHEIVEIAPSQFVLRDKKLVEAAKNDSDIKLDLEKLGWVKGEYGNWNNDSLGKWTGQVAFNESTSAYSLLIPSSIYKNTPNSGNHLIYKEQDESNTEFAQRITDKGIELNESVTEYEAIKSPKKEALKSEKSAQSEVDQIDKVNGNPEPSKEETPALENKPEQPTEHPYQKYDELANQYRRSVKPDGSILKSNGQDTGVKISEKKGRLRIDDSTGKTLFTGATNPESLGKFLEDYWYDTKSKPKPKPEPTTQEEPKQAPPADDIGRTSDNAPFANESAAKMELKKQSLESSHEIVQLSPSKFVLRKKVKSEDDSLKSGSEEVALAQNPLPPFQKNDAPDTIKKNDIGRESNNKPFANKSAAITAIKKKGLLDTHEVVQLAPSQFVLREKLDSEQEQYESSISDMNNAKQSTHKTVAPVARDHLLKDSLDDIQHSKSEIIHSIPNELMDQVHKLEDILNDLSSLKTDEVKTNELYNKELLTKLAKLNPDVRVHIVSDLVNSSDPIIQSISDQLQEGGFYSIDSRISYIYPRSSEWKGTLPELINHELIHAATQEYIDTDKLTPEQLEHLEEIKEAIWSNNRENFDDIDSDVLDRINYSIFTSYPHEMFTVFGAESSSREILSRLGILDRFDTIFNNVLKEAANDNGQIEQRSSGRVNEKGTSERVSGNAFRVPGTIPAIRTATSSSENIERSTSNQPASLSSAEKNEVGQVDDKRKQNSNSDSDMPLHSRTKNQKVQGSNPKQIRTELVKRFGEDAINRLESNGVLSIVPTYSEQGVEGFAENGHVTLIAEAITVENIVPVFLHELGGHVGMQGVMKPAAYAVLMKEFNRLVKNGNAEALEAKQLAERETDPEVWADEYLPYLITVAAQNQQRQGPVQKLVSRIFGAVKVWAVDKLGLNLKLNPSDLVALAERMIKTVANNPTPPKGERRYSRSSTANPQNMSQTKQREFLDKAASTAFGQMALRGAEGTKTLSSRTLNLFQTMLHKSLRDETGQFKKTFDLVQGKINHVTFASSKSMDVAPNVLIQLEQGGDYWKEVKRVGRTLGNTLSAGKINKAKVDTDLKKVGDLMFENTLMDNSERHSIKDLKQLGFDDDQIGLYNEVRDAIDTSLDTFANTTFSNIYKHLGGTNEEVLELAGQDLDILDHYNEILKRIDTLTKGKPEKAEARQAAIEAIDRVFKKANDLKDQGYVPLMRFGKYFVRIHNPTTDEVAYRQHFESESERNLFYRNYDQSKIPVGYEIEEGQINELQHKLFQGVSPETVALFAKESGLPIRDTETAYIKYAVQNNHALKRLLKRQGIDGFDNDLKRVLASFVMSNARYSANQTYNPAIDESITNIKDPAYQEDAIRLRDYSLDTQEELAAFKNFAFVYYMGFSAMFGVVNLTQPLLQTFPYLMQYSRDKGIIFRAFRKAVITWRKGTDAMDRKYRDHYERARKEGHLDPQNTWMMQGLERGKSGLGASTWQLISHASGLFAQASETVNRRTTLFAALDVAESMGQAKLEKMGFKDAYDFAIRTIQETQGIYNKGNRPRVARGNIGSILMMYKQFMISYIEQMARMQKSGLYGGEDDEFKKKMAALVGFGVSRSVLAMLGLLFFFSGATGLPFMRDILDGIETAGGLVGKPLNTEREIQIALHNALGQTLGSAATTVLMDGAFNLNPLVDVKGRMGMGDLIPVTAYFSPTTSEYMKSAELANVAGPMGGLVEKVKEAVLLAQVGSYGQAGIQLLPKAITSTGQGAIAAATGDYRNMKTGVKTNSVEPWEGALKMMDMQPSSIAKEGRIRGLEMKDKAAQDYVNKRWKERYEKALATGDRTAVREVQQQIKDYNKENERYPIKFNQKTAETNFKKSNQSWQEKRKNVKGLEWMSDYNPYLDQ